MADEIATYPSDEVDSHAQLGVEQDSLRQESSNRSVKVVAERVQFQGPLPPPEVLGKYEAIQSGFAERIIRMAENEQAHRHAVEKSVVDSSFSEAHTGQLYGLIIGVVAILAGTFAAVMGAPIPGAIIGGGGVIGLVSVFVLGRFFPTGKPDTSDSSIQE